MLLRMIRRWRHRKGLCGGLSPSEIRAGRLFFVSPIKVLDSATRFSGVLILILMATLGSLAVSAAPSSGGAQPQEARALNGEENHKADEIRLDPYLEVLPPQKERLDISGLSMIADWRVAYSEEGQKLLDYAGNWYRLKIGPWFKESADWVLLYPLAKNFAMYRQQGRQLKISHHGYKDDVSDKIRYRKTVLFLSDLQPDETLYFWIAGASKRSSHHPVMMKAAPFMDLISRDNLTSAFYYSLFLGIALLALFTYSAIRERIYLFYCGYLLSMIGVFLGIQGYGYQFFSFWTPGISMLFFGLANSFILLFIESIFHFQHRLARIGIFGLAAVGLTFGVFGLLSSVPRAFDVLYTLGLATQFLISLIALGQGFRAPKDRWLPLFIGINFFISGLGMLNDRVHIPHSDWIDNAFIPITLLESLLFAIALWKRYYLENSEKQKTLEMAQQQNLESLKLKAEKNKLKLQAAVGESAAQIAHDIRSPLSALSLIMWNSNELPEEKRILIRDAVNRINDIANELLDKSRMMKNPQRRRVVDPSKKETVLLASLVDSLVSEKRIQCRDRRDLTISLDVTNAYGLFINVSPVELKRVLSNVINNSVEAIESAKGEVEVTVSADGDQVMIAIRDNGPGMSESLLSQVGQWGFTHGKENSTSGSGLGLYHAKKTMQDSGGLFDISSEPGRGTTVRLSFPKAIPPPWFIDQLVCFPGATIVSLDDDISIHQVWRDRFERLNIEKYGISHSSYTSARDLEQWLLTESADSLSRCLFLVDYELLGQGLTGIDIIKKHNLAAQAILVSSRYDEVSLQKTSEEIGLKMIPKTMANMVPIVIPAGQKDFDAILIDDDELMHLTWKLHAEKRNKKFLGFKSHGDFVRRALDLDPRSPIYIDSKLGDGVRGEVLAKDIHALGFKTIFLCTGYDKDSFPAMPWIRDIVGKIPQW